MSTALQTVNGGGAVTTYSADWASNQAKRDLLRRTFAEGTSEDEFALFVEVAKSSGLNPFQRQIYAIMRRTKINGQFVDKMTIQTGIDGYRLIAARTGLHAGTSDAEYGPLVNGYPEWARVVVKKIVGGHITEWPATARWSEYAQTKDEYRNNSKTGNTILSGLWAKMPYGQIAKCAESLALRRAFPAELSGIYTADEMAQADNEHRAQVARVPSAKTKTGMTISANAYSMDEHASGEADDAIDVEHVEQSPVEAAWSQIWHQCTSIARGFCHTNGIDESKEIWLKAIWTLVHRKFDVDPQAATAEHLLYVSEAIEKAPTLFTDLIGKPKPKADVKDPDRLARESLMATFDEIRKTVEGATSADGDAARQAWKANRGVKSINDINTQSKVAITQALKEDDTQFRVQVEAARDARWEKEAADALAKEAEAPIPDTFVATVDAQEMPAHE